jgi:hypothetical protein
MALINRKPTGWLSGERACELLGIESTAKTSAKTRLANNAAHWGIRKIHLGEGHRSAVVYPASDLYEYIERKEQEASKQIEPRQQLWRKIDPKLLKARFRKKWICARVVVHLLGMVSVRVDDTPEQIQALEHKAIRLLNNHAQNWGIRKIEQRGNIKKSLVAYPEEDVVAYMARKEEEAQDFIKYSSLYPTVYHATVGPSERKWWDNKKLDVEMQLGKSAKNTGKPSSRFIPVEMQPDDGVPPLRGYIEASEVARRFNLSPGRVSNSKFWDQFCIYLGERYCSGKRYNGDLIEMYFQEKREAGEKVYRLSRLPHKHQESVPSFSRKSK